MIELLFCAKTFRRSFVAHLDEIANRKISKCISVFFAPAKIFSENALAIIGKLFQTFVQHDAIFESGVHALAIEWNNCMSGVPDETNLVVVIPWRTANGHE